LSAWRGEKFFCLIGRCRAHDHINTSVTQKPRPYRDSLFAQLNRQEIDEPDRSSSGAFGQRKTIFLSRLAQRIKQATTEAELTNTLRGRAPCPAEQDLAVRQLQIIRASNVRANCSIVLKFDWTPNRPESAVAASLCILEWRTRLLKDFAKTFRLSEDDLADDFVAVPEIWSKDGDPVPLHYHIIMQIPEAALTWFQETAHKRWMQVLDHFELGGRVHIEPITSQRKLSNYIMKQADIDWVAQHILLPIDVEKYRNG